MLGLGLAVVAAILLIGVGNLDGAHQTIERFQGKPGERVRYPGVRAAVAAAVPRPAPRPSKAAWTTPSSSGGSAGPSE